MKALRKFKQKQKRTKTNKQEKKFSKVVEDNSVILERMKKVSSSCDKILECLGNNDKIEIDFNDEDYEKKLMKMLKKDLLELAEALGCDVKKSMTKAAIIEVIREEQEI